MRIRTAIFWVYVVASAAGFSVMMGLVLRDVRLRYVESMRRTLGDTASYLASYAAPKVAGEDWTEKLTKLPQGTGVLRVFACDVNDRVIFDTASRDVGQVYQRLMYGGGKIASENYSIPNVTIVDSELRVFTPVRFEEKIVGWIGVGRPLATVVDGINRARWRLIWMTGGIAMVMVVAGWWIASRLTRSLERLTIYARKVRDGRVPPLPKSRAKEIAELSRAFEEMRDALDGRQHAERYTQALAHEVKAPLAAIRGAAELMDETMPPEQRAKFLDNIRSEAARIQQIVERLLELSSLEARKALRQTEWLSGAELVREAAAVVQPAYAARRVRLTMETAEVTLQGERVLLREALVNLLQNALDFSPAESEVTLSVSGEPDRVVFKVEDRGAGVPDYALARVFERFYSLPRPGGVRKSTGLGLALVQEIAHLHGGAAALTNRAGGGTTASFWVMV